MVTLIRPIQAHQHQLLATTPDDNAMTHLLTMIAPAQRAKLAVIHDGHEQPATRFLANRHELTALPVLDSQMQALSA